MSEQSRKQSQDQAEYPRVIQEIDETSFNYANNLISARQMMEKTFGEESVGWDIVRDDNPSPEQLEQRRIGREVVKIVVTEAGDAHAVEKIKGSHPLPERQDE